MAVVLHVTRDSARKSWAATFDSERLRVMGIPFSELTLQGCCSVTMQLRGDRTTAVFTGTLRGSGMEGTFREEGQEGRFDYVRAGHPTPVLIQREVLFRNGAAELSGTLILPPGPGPHPAVVFLHGSGPEGRWANQFLATAVARRGVAGLIFDKRGVGKSTGDWRTSTLEDLAGDAAAAVRLLHSDPVIDPRRIGIHGHSQGGTLAPMVAVKTPEVAFVIGSAAAGTPTDSTEMYSILNSVYPQAVTAADSADARRYTAALVDAAYHGHARDQVDSMAAQLKGRPWYFAPPGPESSYWSISRSVASFAPLDWWKQVRVPVLLVYGAEDQRVPAQESAARIARAVLGHPYADLTVRIFPGADHTFRLPPGPAGWPGTAPDYLPTLLTWLSARR